MRLSAALLTLSVAAASCGPSAAPPRAPHVRRPRLGGEVVAVVGNTAIRRSEVLERAAASHVDATTALRALESDALLAEEARRRGLVGADASERRRRALAQLVLRALEREHRAESVPSDAIAARLDRAAASLTRPELRQASHLLVRTSGSHAPNPAEAEAIATEALRRAGSVEGEDTALLETVADALRAHHPGVDVVVEALPVVERSASYEPAFLDAIFGMDRVGLVPRVVTTSFGAHVVLVTRVDHAVTPTPEAVHEAALEEALNHDRRNAVGALLREARERTPPRIDESVVARRLGDDRLFGDLR